MRTPRHAIILGCLLTKSRCSISLTRFYNDDPNLQYPYTMCYPNFDVTAANTFIDSPFPCEVRAAILQICFANNTSELDFLAEQQCLCNGAFWDTWRGCDACFFAHGSSSDNPADSAKSISSLSIAECSPSPPSRPFKSLFPIYTTDIISTSVTLVNDNFPNNTAVSNYWTATETALTPGTITGSATGRQTVWNIYGSIVPPTVTEEGSSSTTTSKVSTTPAKSIASPSPSTSKNVAARSGASISGDLLMSLMTFVVFI